MKKTSIILTLAAMLVAMVSCTKENQPVSGTFTMTVNADKGANATKDLSLSGSTLNAMWKEGESVTVCDAGGHCLGFLYATTDGSSTTLTGTINGEIAVNDILTLEFLSEYYDQQEGTLEFIATHSDYAKAEVRITSIAGGSVKTTDAVFENQQAIVKFTLQDMSQNNLNATLLEVTVDGTTYTVDPANDATTNVFYVAIPGFSNKAITLTATVGEDEYTKTVSNVTFTNGNYYTITVGLEPEQEPEPTTVTWNFSSLSGEEAGDPINFTHNGVTLQGEDPSMLIFEEGFLDASVGCTFTNSLGKKFKNIVIYINDAQYINFTGFVINGNTATWSSASGETSVSFSGIARLGITSIVFTLE